MKAIQTKYLPATNTKPSRVKAYTADQSITISYDDEYSQEEAHKKAAVALCNKMGWSTALIAGSIDNGYVFLFEPKSVQYMRDALGNLCQFVQGNRGNRGGNPYSKKELKEALKVLYEDATGNYSEEFSTYANASDKYYKGP